MTEHKETYTIGQISKLLGIKEHTVRFWEKEFPLINPVRKPSGRREYSQADFLLLQQIKKLLYEEGYTSKGALKELTNMGLDRDIVLHDNDLFSSSDTLQSDINTQHIAQSNQKSQHTLKSFQASAKPIQKQVEQAVWKKFYEKVNQLIQFLEN